MLAVIDEFYSMDQRSQENYIVGRRLGRYRRLSDNHNSAEIEAVKNKLVSSYGTLDAAMLQVLTNYI